ncbi:MAG TPA: hypothetical protein VEP49_20790 [Acidimicrobiia bacterium]|nr:hypothetical protein [Acidimicrobiia bacterium]
MSGSSGGGDCFVISPIGLEGSEVRKHADTVYRFVIKPAVEKCGCRAARSDQIPEPGRISEKMFTHILGGEFCIAVLTDHNPNVFYELAIAHAAARPVILLLAKGQTVPFDVADHAYVEYDISDVEGLVDGKYADAVAAHIEAFRRKGAAARVPFRPDLSPLGGHSDANLRFVDGSEKFGESADWMRLLEETERDFQIMGIDLYSWRYSQGKDTTFAQLVCEKADRGCKVKMLLMHPDNPAFESTIAEMAWKLPIAVYRNNATQAFDFFHELAGEHANIMVRQVVHGCVLSQLTVTDNQAVYCPSMFSQRARFSPLWDCDNDHPLYEQLRQEFRTMWDANDRG